MRVLSKVFLIATAVFAVVSMAAPPAEASGKWRARWAFSSDHGHPGRTPGSPGGSSGSSSGNYQGGSGTNRGAPGPIAGAGLPFLLLAGGYALVRRYRKRAQL